jgi:hypothetical protein
MVDEAIANSSLCKAEEIVGTLPSTKPILVLLIKHRESYLIRNQRI